jgi:small-conductance mechanosensitive channel
MNSKLTKNISALFSSGLCILLLASSSVYAETSNTAGTNTQTKEITDRVTQRKNLLKLQLPNDKSQKLAKKCTAAQKLIKSINAQDNNKATKRQQVYTNISTRLNIIIDGLNKRSIDTTELKSLQDQFNTTANQYLVDASTYKTAMEDLSEMDCTADPAGFAATLSTSRQLRTKLSSEVGQVKAIKSQISQSVANAVGLVNSSSKQGANQ